jgi:hypothetical protein
MPGTYSSAKKRCGKKPTIAKNDDQKTVVKKKKFEFTLR